MSKEIKPRRTRSNTEEKKVNLLISGNSTAWKSNTYLFPRERCLTEYITNDLRTRFSNLGENEIKKLLKIPAIFAYEQVDRKDAYIGKITGITVRQQNVKIDYQLTGEKIAYKDFINLKSLLDLGEWELNRTHWTIKKIDINDIKPYFKNNRGNQPTVFISYSWTPPENQMEVAKLIEKLKKNKITVIYDKKDLKPGQDKNYFMEKALTNKKIDKVLIVCNRDYVRKANKRKGGVGYEYDIIITKISEKPLQTRFIPIVIEKDKNEKPYLPTFLKKITYIDLTKENGYKELLSTIKSNDKVRSKQ